MAPTTPLTKKKPPPPPSAGRPPTTASPSTVRASELARSPGLHRARGPRQQQADHAGGQVHPPRRRNQVKGLGFSFVEILSPCPTIWKMQPLEAQTFVREEMASVFGVANYRDRSKDAQPRPAPPPPPALDALPALLGLETLTQSRDREGAGTDQAATTLAPDLDMRIKVAGFGGQGVLMLGEVLAEAGLESGYEVSWLPSYGPEMRSGTSNCHVRLSTTPIDSPLVSPPQRASGDERAVAPEIPAGRGARRPRRVQRSGPSGRLLAHPDVRIVARPFTEMADQLGGSKVANIVMLGSLLEAAGLLDQERVVGALRRLSQERPLVPDRPQGPRLRPGSRQKGRRLSLGRLVPRAALRPRSPPTLSAHVPENGPVR